MKFVTLFENLENVHLIKDPGMLSYIMRKYYGFEATVIGSSRESYDYEYNFYDVDILKIKDFSSKSFIKRLLRIKWLCKNANKVDVLNVFFYNNVTLLYIAIYKRINKKGLVYVHCDSNPTKMLESKKAKGLVGHIKRWLVSEDMLQDVLWGVQSEEKIQELRSRWPFINVEFVPDGCFWESENEVLYENKENVFLTVGRLGSVQKRTDLLLEAYAKYICSGGDWRLRLVGPIDKSFEGYIEDYFRNHPQLKNLIDFAGPIYDRNELGKEYEKAKVFTLTSDYENFPISQVEAMSKGCALLCSDFRSAVTIITQGNFGEYFHIGDSDELAQKMFEITKDENRLHEITKTIQAYAYTNYNWKNVVKPIVSFVRKENV